MIEKGVRLGPRVVSPYSESVLGAFSRRRKAIKYRLRTFEVVFGVEGVPAEEVQELEVIQVEAKTIESPETQILFKIWEDGEAWLRICRAGTRKEGGWRFLESFQGNVRLLEGADLVRCFEASLSAAHSPRDGSDLRRKIIRAWSGYLN